MCRRCRDQLESIHNLVRGDGEKIPDGEGAALDQESKGRMKALIEREKGPYPEHFTNLLLRSRRAGTTSEGSNTLSLGGNKLRTV